VEIIAEIIFSLGYKKSLARNVVSL